MKKSEVNVAFLFMFVIFCRNISAVKEILKLTNIFGVNKILLIS